MKLKDISYITYIGSQMKESFGGMSFNETGTDGLIERKLPRHMSSSEILTELGPEPIELADMSAFLKTADRSKWFLFYVADAEGVVWAVLAYWLAGRDGWHVEASSVSYPDSWDADYQVVSRRFSDTEQQSLRTSVPQTLPETLIINGITYKKT